LDAHGDFVLADACDVGVDQAGLRELCGGGLRQVVRIFPHRSPGEGHFAALFERTGIAGGGEDGGAGGCAGGRSGKKSLGASRLSSLGRDMLREFGLFCENFLFEQLQSEQLQCERFQSKRFSGGIVSVHGDNIYYTPVPLDLSGLRVARSGWHVGSVSKNRFSPSHALAMGLKEGGARFSVDLSEEDAWRYLRGQSPEWNEWSAEREAGAKSASTEKPWVLICCRSHPLGWARLVSGRLKNQMPVGWVVS